MTVVPCTSRAEKVFKSDYIPAPVPESEPAIIKPVGGFNFPPQEFLLLDTLISLLWF